MFVVNIWPRFRALLATDYPPPIAISVLLDDISFALERADNFSRMGELNSNVFSVNDLEREVSIMKADILAMNR